MYHPFFLPGGLCFQRLPASCSFSLSLSLSLRWLLSNRYHCNGCTCNNTKEAHKNNNDNNTTPVFIGLNETTQQIRTQEEEGSATKIMSDVLKQMYAYFIVNDENALTLEYFNLTTNAV
jgi:hypothetical protein